MSYHNVKKRYFNALNIVSLCGNTIETSEEVRPIALSPQHSFDTTDFEDPALFSTFSSGDNIISNPHHLGNQEPTEELDI